MKPELKHWSAYLPFGLKVKIDTTRWYEKREPFIAKLIGIFDFETLTVKYIDEYSTTYSSNTDDFTPILRPLSDLTKEIEVGGERFVPIDKIDYEFGMLYYFASGNKGLLIKRRNTNIYAYSMDYFLIQQKLFEWHFDVFGLIEQGLAIDINTLSK